MRGAVAAVALLVTACGAAQTSTSTSTSVSPSVSPSISPSISPPISWVVAGVDLGGPVAPIALEVPASGGVHDCLFVLVERTFTGWGCTPDRWRGTLPFTPEASERLLAAFAAIDDWGTPLAEGDVRPATFTLYPSRDATVRFDAASSPGLAAFRDTALALAQEALAAHRAEPENCTGCPEGEYCHEGMHCYTMGPDRKSCAVARECNRQLPPTSRCQFDYECLSLHCDGRDELVGRCG